MIDISLNNLRNCFSRKSSLIFLFIFLLFVVLAFYFIFLSKRNLTIYENPQYKFSFQYPSNLEQGKISEKTDTTTLLSQVFVDPSSSLITDVSIKTADSKTFIFWEHFSGKKAQSVSVGSNEGKKLEWVQENNTVDEDRDFYNIKVFVEKDNLIYTISFFIDNADSNKAEEIIAFNKMLESWLFF